MTVTKDDELPVFFDTDAAIRASHEYGPGGLLEWELEEDPQPEPVARRGVTAI